MQKVLSKVQLVKGIISRSVNGDKDNYEELQLNTMREERIGNIENAGDEQQPEPWVIIQHPNLPAPPKPPQLQDINRVESLWVHLDNTIRQNPESPEIFKLQNAVESFITSVLRSMKCKDKSLEFQLLRCGSYYEGLRVGRPYEFDYMLELVHFKATQVIPNLNNRGIPNELEHMEVKFVSSEARQMGIPCNIYAASQLHFDKYKRKLVPVFRECIRKHDSYKGIQVMEVCDHYNSPNFKLFLKFEGKGIMIDLVPCVKFPEHCADILPAYITESIDMVMQFVPNCPKDRETVKKFMTKHLYLVCTDLDSKWRISTSMLEYEIITNLPNIVKRALRIMKYLCNMHFVYPEPQDTKYLHMKDSLRLYGYKAFIPSYALKQLFLHKLMEYITRLNDPSLEENIVYAMLNYLKDFHNCTLKSYGNSKVEIRSFLFGERHLHRFIFGQDLALLRNRREPGRWYKQMIRQVEEIIQNENNAIAKCKQMLNYPLLEGVKCYDRPNLYA